MAFSFSHPQNKRTHGPPARPPGDRQRLSPHPGTGRDPDADMSDRERRDRAGRPGGPAIVCSAPAAVPSGPSGSDGGRPVATPPRKAWARPASVADAMAMLSELEEPYQDHDGVIGSPPVFTGEWRPLTLWILVIGTLGCCVLYAASRRSHHLSGHRRAVFVPAYPGSRATTRSCGVLATRGSSLSPPPVLPPGVPGGRR